MLGDDEDDEELVAEERSSSKSKSADSQQVAGVVPVSYEAYGGDDLLPSYEDAPPSHDIAAGTSSSEKQRLQPQIHYIQPDDTLLGLSMRYGVDVRSVTCSVPLLRS